MSSSCSVERRQTFDAVSPSSTEQEQGVGNKEGHVETCFDGGGQTVNAVAKIGMTADYIDCSEFIELGIPKHYAPP